VADGEAGKNDPAQLYQSQLVDHEITDALKAMPEEYRSTLLLVDIEDLSYEEAANVLGCPIGTVRSRLSRARRLLQKALTDYARKRGYMKDQAKGRSSPVRESSSAHVPSSSIKG
jgi:RNA polymerase sigma-70 factor (ECF subfamily)